MTGQLDIFNQEGAPPGPFPGFVSATHEAIFDLWLFYELRERHDGRRRYGEPEKAQHAVAWLTETSTYGPILTRQLAWMAPVHVIRLAEEYDLSADHLMEREQAERV